MFTFLCPREFVGKLTKDKINRLVRGRIMIS